MERAARIRAPPRPDSLLVAPPHFSTSLSSWGLPATARHAGALQPASRIAPLEGPPDREALRASALRRGPGADHSESPSPRAAPAPLLRRGHDAPGRGTRGGFSIGRAVGWWGAGAVPLAPRQARAARPVRPLPSFLALRPRTSHHQNPIQPTLRPCASTCRRFAPSRSHTRPASARATCRQSTRAHGPPRR